MRIVTPQSYIYSNLYYTSGATFNKMMREKAKKANLKLNEWVFMKEILIIKFHPLKPKKTFLKK